MTIVSLRDRQQVATRQAIIEAFLALSHRGGAMTVSIPAVAEEAGVSIRTIYRYFANKHELQTAAAYHMSEQALDGGSMADSNPANLRDQLTRLWTGLAANVPAVIAERTAPAGRAIRITRLQGAREAAARFVPSRDPATIDLVIALTSSSMFLELVERMGHEPGEAADMAARMVDLVLADERAEDPTS